MTHAWTATDREDIIHPGLGVTDAVTLSWSMPGVKTVVVTVTGGGISASATRKALAFDVAVNGLTQGEPDHTYTFDAALTPASTGFLVTYTWQATGLNPVIHPDQGTTDAASFTWITPGTKTVTVTATTAGAMAQAIHTIDIEGTVLDEFVYLPLLR
jgi:hypothetical protein